MYGLSDFKTFLEQFVAHIRCYGCATSPKVAASIPDVVLGIFQSLKPSGRTMARGSNQPLTEMNTRNTSCGVKAVVA
jgi:hypothetical protein